MTDEFTDVELNTLEGYHDISFEDGDFKKLKGFDTAIFISLMTDARASQNQVPQPEKRRGWIGNLNNPVELGSLIWLYEQARLITATVNGVTDQAKKSLQWFIDFSYATDVTVTSSRTRDSILADIDIQRADGSVETTRLTLWENTPTSE